MAESNTPRHSLAVAIRKRELACARRMWADPTVLGTSGVVIFLTYISVPSFTLVPLHAPERTTAALAAERRFMTLLVDLGDERALDGGIDNPLVRRMVRDLARRHRGYAGMKLEYLDVMAAVIALAPLRVRAVMEMELPEETRASYWHYMRRAMAIFGCSLPADERTAEADCDRYTAQHAGTSARGARFLRLIETAYPQYAHAALPALFPASREAILKIMGSAHGIIDR